MSESAGAVCSRCGGRYPPGLHGIQRCPGCGHLNYLGVPASGAAALSGAAEPTRTERLPEPPRGAAAPWVVGQRVAGLFNEDFTLEEIKAGGMGVVLIARGETSGRTLAFKTHADDVERDAAAFRGEAENWVALGRHTHIVRALAVFDRDDRLYLALEHIPAHPERGTDLGEWIASGSVDARLALDIAVQVCRAFEHAAARGGFVHRDLKPSNVLVAPDGTAKLTDFGISRAVPHARRVAAVAASSVYGTPLYMAPEQWKKGGRLDARTDIYAFGCLLHAMLAGRPPFVADDITELERAHAEDAPPPLTAAPAGLAEVAARCLAKDPAARWGDFSALREALERVMREAGWPPPPAPASHPASTADAVNDAHNLLVLGKLDEARRLLETAAAERPNDANVFINRGAAKGLAGDLAGEIEDLERALEIDPKSAAAYRNRAQVRMKLGEFSGALADFKRARKLRTGEARHGDRDRAAEYWLIALGRLMEGDAAGADAAFTEAVGLAPDLWEAFAFRSQARVALGDVDGALADVERAFVLNPSSPLPHALASNIHNAAQDSDAALAACERALGIDPHCVMAYNNRAAAHFNAGNFDDCVLDCREAIARLPSAPMPYLNRANALLELGRGADALPDYRKALELGLPAPWNDVARAGIEHVENG